MRAVLICVFALILCLSQFDIPERAMTVFTIMFVMIILVPFCLPILMPDRKFLIMLAIIGAPVLGYFLWREQQYASALSYRDYADFSLGLLRIVVLFFGLGVAVRFVGFSMQDRGLSMIWVESVAGLAFIAPFAYIAISYALHIWQRL